METSSGQGIGRPRKHLCQNQRQVFGIIPVKSAWRITVDIKHTNKVTGTVAHRDHQFRPG